MEMTPRERVEAVMFGRDHDYVPFTIYEALIPRCAAERRLRNEGLCIVNRLGVVATQNTGIKETTIQEYDNKGQTVIRRRIETPAGTLSTIAHPFSGRRREGFLFNKPEDYKPLEYIYRHRVHAPNFAAYRMAEERDGGDSIFRAAIGYEPLNEIMIALMGQETFAIEWMERRDEVIKLYEAVRDSRRAVYGLVAESPAMHANYGGNVIPQMIGDKVFEQYILPDYQECAEVMHRHGKLLGTHLDDDNRLLAPLVAQSGLDYIEAFTPPPDCDFSVQEALEAWPDKFLWINFPSSVHIMGTDKIREATMEILEQSKPGNRLIVGITEDVPANCWEHSFSTILDTLKTAGRISVR